MLRSGLDLVLQTDQDVTALDPHSDGARGFCFPETADVGQHDIEGLDADMSEGRIDIINGASIHLANIAQGEVVEFFAGPARTGQTGCHQGKTHSNISRHRDAGKKANQGHLRLAVGPSSKE